MWACSPHKQFWTKMKNNHGFKKTNRNQRFQVTLFKPLYLVFIFIMKNFSLSFLIAASWLNIFFNYANSHVRNFVTLHVEMLACCFVDLLVNCITLVFTETILKCSFTFPYILDRTLGTRNTIQDISCLAVDLLVYVNSIVGYC